MWINDMQNPETFTRGVREAESLMQSRTVADGADVTGAMPFLDYFYLQCKNHPKSNLDHFINVLAVTGHVLFYFSKPANIYNLYGLTCLGNGGIDAKTAKKLTMKPGSKKLGERFWPAALLTSALLHDLGKTLTHEKDPFFSVQHANRGYLLFYEAMIGDKITDERQELADFILNAGFPADPQYNYVADFIMVIQASILFHDRLGVWMTAESGAAPAAEIIETLTGVAEITGLDYEKLAFMFFALTLADIMASVPAPVYARSVLRFPDRNKPHPLKDVAPGHIDSTEMIEDFLCSLKGVKTLGLLPVLLNRDAGYFQAEAPAGKRFYRMIANARSVSAPWRAYLSDLNNLEINVNDIAAVKQRGHLNLHFDKVLRSAADALTTPAAADGHMSGTLAKLIGDIEKTREPGDLAPTNAVKSCANVLTELNRPENEETAAACRYVTGDIAALVDLTVDAFIYEAAMTCPLAADPPREIQHMFDGFGVWDYALERFGAPFGGALMAGLMDRTPRSSGSVEKIVRLWVENMTVLLSGYYESSRLDRDNVVNLEFKKHASPYPYVSPVMRV